MHANDQCTFEWTREGQQPLQNKSRGRIVHISDFIIEHCGRVALSEEEIAAQMKLPEYPKAAPSSSDASPHSAGNSTTPAAKKGRRGKKKPTAKSTEGRTLAEHSGVSQDTSTTHTQAYRLDSFDARRIIYPGSQYDPWWDMPQLIAQV